MFLQQPLLQWKCDENLFSARDISPIKDFSGLLMVHVPDAKVFNQNQLCALSLRLSIALWIKSKYLAVIAKVLPNLFPASTQALSHRTASLALVHTKFPWLEASPSGSSIGRLLPFKCKLKLPPLLSLLSISSIGRTLILLMCLMCLFCA